MKYCLIIPDGAADAAQDSLGGRTPLEAAATPNMDAMAAAGRVGTVLTIPEGYAPGSDVAIMSVLGYAPQDYYSGRAPLEAASMGISLQPGDYAVRCNLVTIADSTMADYSSGHISPAEAVEIMATLNAEIGGEGVEFYPGKGYRNILVVRGAGSLDVETTPPHDIAGEKITAHLPRGADAKVFLGLMEKSRGILSTHEVNRRRKSDGKLEATSIWLWGEGRSAVFPSFAETYGVRAAVITAVDLVAGICALTGWERIDVPGATGYYDTDYRGKGRAAAEALSAYDMVFVHVEAPDEASHDRDVEAKVKAIEEIDKHVVGPLMEAAAAFGRYRMLVLPDHYTLLSTAGHSKGAVPFAVCGEGINTCGAAHFDERHAALGMKFSSGPQLMSAFLGEADQWD